VTNYYLSALQNIYQTLGIVQVSRQREQEYATSPEHLWKRIQSTYSASVSSGATLSIHNRAELIQVPNRSVCFIMRVADALKSKPNTAEASTYGALRFNYDSACSVADEMPWLAGMMAVVTLVVFAGDLTLLATVSSATQGGLWQAVYPCKDARLIVFAPSQRKWIWGGRGPGAPPAPCAPDRKVTNSVGASFWCVPY
jgi:hypothetical protein